MRNDTANNCDMDEKPSSKAMLLFFLLLPFEFVIVSESNWQFLVYFIIEVLIYRRLD